MEKLLYSIQEGKVNGFVTQPWIISSILKSHNVDKYDISSLKFILCSGAIVDKNMCSSFYNRFAVPVINSYGMTELVTGHQSTFSGSLEGRLTNMIMKSRSLIFFLFCRQCRYFKTWIFVQNHR